MEAYTDEVEEHMVALYESLSEKDRRRYAAVEAEKLGHGGIQYVSDLFGCDPDTVRHGHRDVEQLPVDDAAGASEKKGGRKKASIAQPKLLDAVRRTMANHIAGSPVDADILWTNRSPRDIAQELTDLGFDVCPDTVRRILTDDLGLGVRQAVKDEARSVYPFRDEQFEYIAEVRGWYERKRWPVLSIDTKKKELLGDFFRPGKAYTDGTVHVLDHDFSTLGHGRLVPYGIYDVQRNEGFMLLSVGSDTSELVADAIRRWWQRRGRHHYSYASRLLLLCDCGGSNGNRHYVFKEAMYWLARDLDRPIQIAHYPPSCSKYNPIEHNMFCHVTRAMQGVILRTLDIAKRAIACTSTATGLRVIVETARKLYEKGQKATAEFLNAFPIELDEFLPDLNYTALNMPLCANAEVVFR